jgi:hypothetical protein
MKKIDGTDDIAFVALTWQEWENMARQKDTFRNTRSYVLSLNKMQSPNLFSRDCEKLTRCCHNTMSDKGEALASELAALSVEEASAPPDGDGEKPSAEPAEGADPGGKITGVVSWFNVAKGFGARAWFPEWQSPFSSARVRAARRPRARARGAIAMPRCFFVIP